MYSKQKRCMLTQTCCNHLQFAWTRTVETCIRNVCKLQQSLSFNQWPQWLFTSSIRKSLPLWIQEASGLGMGPRSAMGLLLLVKHLQQTPDGRGGMDPSISPRPSGISTSTLRFNLQGALIATWKWAPSLPALPLEAPTPEAPDTTQPDPGRVESGASGFRTHNRFNLQGSSK